MALRVEWAKILFQGSKFKEIEIAFLCEYSGHKSIGKKRKFSC